MSAARFLARKEKSAGALAENGTARSSPGSLLGGKKNLAYHRQRSGPTKRFSCGKPTRALKTSLSTSPLSWCLSNRSQTAYGHYSPRQTRVLDQIKERWRKANGTKRHARNRGSRRGSEQGRERGTRKGRSGSQGGLRGGGATLRERNIGRQTGNIGG